MLSALLTSVEPHGVILDTGVDVDYETFVTLAKPARGTFFLLIVKTSMWKDPSTERLGREDGQAEQERRRRNSSWGRHGASCQSETEEEMGPYKNSRLG